MTIFRTSLTALAIASACLTAQAADPFFLKCDIEQLCNRNSCRPPSIYSDVFKVDVDNREMTTDNGKWRARMETVTDSSFVMNSGGDVRIVISRVDGSYKSYRIRDDLLLASGRCERARAQF